MIVNNVLRIVVFVKGITHVLNALMDIILKIINVRTVLTSARFATVYQIVFLVSKVFILIISNVLLVFLAVRNAMTHRLVQFV
jgi:hypothetical protein